MDEKDFIPGKIGSLYLPKVWMLSEFPEAVDREELLENNYMDESSKSAIRKEIGESDVIKGVKEYLEMHKKEDVFVVFNQDIKPNVQDVRKWQTVCQFHLRNSCKYGIRCRRIHLCKYDLQGICKFGPKICRNGHLPNYENDALLINLTKGYILVIEAKYNVNPSSFKKGIRQLKVRQNILAGFAGKLSKDWRVIKILYGSKIQKTVCQNCSTYFFSREINFVQQLNKILSAYQNTDWPYVADFSNLVKEIVQRQVRISSKLSDSMLMNKTIFEKISHNIEIAGSAENILFWTSNQYEVASNCLKMKRVMFPSGPSTGKTTLMLYCVEKLLERNEKCLFIIHHAAESLYSYTRPEDTTNSLPLREKSRMKTKSLLTLKLEGYFGNNENVKIIWYDMEPVLGGMVNGPEETKTKQIENLLRKYKDWNIFIDEFNPHISFHKSWSETHNPEKHFWLVHSSYWLDQGRR